MKLLLVLAVVLLGVWLWRSGRGSPSSGGQAKPPSASTPPAPPQDMVACALCGLHVPRSEAVEGRQGRYCCSEHRQRAEP